MSVDNFQRNHRERPTFTATTVCDLLLKGSPREGEFELAVVFKPKARSEWYASMSLHVTEGPFETARKLEALAVLIRDMHLKNGRVR